MKIEKRDGRIQDFDQSKIADAVQKAAEACKWGTIEASNLGKRIAHSVTNKVSSWGTKPVSIETVQDEVEDSLMGKDSSRDVAKAYIKYREKRAEVREGKSKLMSVIGSIVVDEAQGNDSQRENANVDTDAPMGAMLKIGSEASKEFALNTMITTKFAKMHRDGYIHIHDLDFYALTTTCTQISLKKLFKNGFFTGHGQIREPNSIASYMSLACIAIQANQNDQHKPHWFNCAFA